MSVAASLVAQGGNLTVVFMGICNRRYAWDWLAILLLMVVLVITEELKPFEKAIYNESDQVLTAFAFARQSMCS